jgi:2-dehydro-3-deoxygluconokinase
MMRLNPKGYNRFVQAGEFEVSYAGAEANVAVGLSNFGLDTCFVTKLPPHEIGQSAINELRRFGVNTSMIVRGGDRVGIYFVEKGASQRASKVIYDRAYSAIAQSESGDFDWETILAGADWFHFTGITPALSDTVAQICKKALDTAKKLGLKVSCDLNYRKKLWSKEKAGKVMAELLPMVDYCIANEEDAADVFGIKAGESDVEKGKLDHNAYLAVARQLAERFGLKKIAFTLRGSISATDNTWSGVLYDRASDRAVFAPEYIVHIVDRVGGGDSFGAGLIYSLLAGWDDQRAINFSVAASCLKHSIEHDFNQISFAEAEALAAGNASGRVQR